MTLQVLDATGTKQNLSTTNDATGAALVGSTTLADPATGNKAMVGAFHSSDAQAPGSVYGLLAGAVGLLFNGTTLDRMRSAPGTVGVAAVNTEGSKATYSLVVSDFAPAATATDIFVLPGSATKTIRVTSICISGDATAAASLDVYAYKRTAANTGGTTASLAANISQHDSSDAAASAVPVTYTANPTGLGAGTLVRAAARWFFPAAGTAALTREIMWDFTTRNSKALVLRGTAQSLAINLNGQTIPAGMSLYITVEWSEE